MVPLWDRASTAYLDEWSPRFLPYHVDLIREASPPARGSVLVVCSGPGHTAIAAARAVGDGGRVRVVEPSSEMVAVCMQRIGAAGVPAAVNVDRSEAMDTSGGPWDAIVCGFGVSELTRGLSHPDLAPTPGPVLSAWGDALSPHGKVGLLFWGPLEPDDPHARLLHALAELEPHVTTALPDPRVGRRDIAELLGSGGLALARHTTVTHDLMFRTAEQFALAVRRACSWRATFDALGEVRTGKVLARFYDSVGGPEKPLVYQPTATIAIAALPGAEIELPHRPSVRVPTGR